MSHTAETQNWRTLSPGELALVAGGNWTVTAPYRWSYQDYKNHYKNMFPPQYEWHDDTGGSSEPTNTPPPCNLVNAISGLSPPDGASYYVPEGIDANYLIAALNHLSNFSRENPAWKLLLEFKAMYQNPSHPHFLDFKDWGQSGGPPGSVAPDPVSYYSTARGETIQASAFEAFGNFFYGFAGTWAGISADVLFAGAAIMQEGSTNWIPADSPEDRPHVNYGINAARAHAISPNPFVVDNAPCGTTGQPQSVSGAALAAQADASQTYANADYREGLWSVLEQEYHAF